MTDPLRVPTQHNLADGFTKSLDSVAVGYLTPMMKGYAPITEEAAPIPVERRYAPSTVDDSLDQHIADPVVRAKLKAESSRPVKHTEIIPLMSSLTPVASRNTPAARVNVTTRWISDSLNQEGELISESTDGSAIDRECQSGPDPAAEHDNFRRAVTIRDTAL